MIVIFHSLTTVRYRQKRAYQYYIYHKINTRSTVAPKRPSVSFVNDMDHTCVRERKEAIYRVMLT